MALGDEALLVDTHSNGDHCNGNELLDCEVIASAATSMEVAADMGVTGRFFLHCFSAFPFADIDRPTPTVTFEDRIERIVTLVDTWYREFLGDTDPTPVMALIEAMAEPWADQRT